MSEDEESSVVNDTAKAATARTDDKKSVLVIDIWHSQSYWPIQGWGAPMNTTSTPHFWVPSMGYASDTLPIDLAPPSKWTWVGMWEIDLSSAFGAHDADGWYYNTSYTQLSDDILTSRGSDVATKTCLVRRRRLLRTLETTCPIILAQIRQRVSYLQNTRRNIETGMREKEESSKSLMFYEENRAFVFEQSLALAAEGTQTTLSALRELLLRLTKLSQFLLDRATLRYQYAVQLQELSRKYFLPDYEAVGGTGLILGSHDVVLTSSGGGSGGPAMNNTTSGGGSGGAPEQLLSKQRSLSVPASTTVAGAGAHNNRRDSSFSITSSSSNDNKTSYFSSLRNSFTSTFANATTASGGGSKVTTTTDNYGDMTFNSITSSADAELKTPEKASVPHSTNTPTTTTISLEDKEASAILFQSLSKITNRSARQSIRSSRNLKLTANEEIGYLSEQITLLLQDAEKTFAKNRDICQLCDKQSRRSYMSGHEAIESSLSAATADIVGIVEELSVLVGHNPSFVSFGPDTQQQQQQSQPPPTSHAGTVSGGGGGGGGGGGSAATATRLVTGGTAAVGLGDAGTAGATGPRLTRSVYSSCMLPSPTSSTSTSSSSAYTSAAPESSEVGTRATITAAAADGGADGGAVTGLTSALTTAESEDSAPAPTPITTTTTTTTNGGGGGGGTKNENRSDWNSSASFRTRQDAWLAVHKYRETIRESQEAMCVLISEHMDLDLHMQILANRCYQVFANVSQQFYNDQSALFEDSLKTVKDCMSDCIARIAALGRPNPVLQSPFHRIAAVDANNANTSTAGSSGGSGGGGAVVDGSDASSIAAPSPLVGSAATPSSSRSPSTRGSPATAADAAGGRSTASSPLGGNGIQYDDYAEGVGVFSFIALYKEPLPMCCSICTSGSVLLCNALEFETACARLEQVKATEQGEVAAAAAAGYVLPQETAGVSGAAAAAAAAATAAVSSSSSSSTGGVGAIDKEDNQELQEGEEEGDTGHPGAASVTATMAQQGHYFYGDRSDAGSTVSSSSSHLAGAAVTTSNTTTTPTTAGDTPQKTTHHQQRSASSTYVSATAAAKAGATRCWHAVYAVVTSDGYLHIMNSEEKANAPDTSYFLQDCDIEIVTVKNTVPRSSSSYENSNEDDTNGRVQVIKLTPLTFVKKRKRKLRRKSSIVVTKVGGEAIYLLVDSLPSTTPTPTTTGSGPPPPTNPTGDTPTAAVVVPLQEWVTLLRDPVGSAALKQEALVDAEAHAAMLHSMDIIRGETAKVELDRRQFDDTNPNDEEAEEEEEDEEEGEEEEVEEDSGERGGAGGGLEKVVESTPVQPTASNTSAAPTITGKESGQKLTEIDTSAAPGQTLEVSVDDGDRRSTLRRATSSSASSPKASAAASAAHPADIEQSLARGTNKYIFGSGTNYRKGSNSWIKHDNSSSGNNNNEDGNPTADRVKPLIPKHDARVPLARRHSTMIHQYEAGLELEKKKIDSRVQLTKRTTYEAVVGSAGDVESSDTAAVCSGVAPESSAAAAPVAVDSTSTSASHTSSTPSSTAAAAAAAAGKEDTVAAAAAVASNASSGKESSHVKNLKVKFSST